MEKSLTDLQLPLLVGELYTTNKVRCLDNLTLIHFYSKINTRFYSTQRFNNRWPQGVQTFSCDMV